MKKINITLSVIFVFIICLISDSHAYMGILNNGNWFEEKIEDPMTDEIIYKSYLNSEDRQKGFDHIGSEARLYCLYNKTKNTLDIRIEMPIACGENQHTYSAKYRFDKEEPRTCEVFLKKDNDEDVYCIVGPDTINNMQEGFTRSKRFVLYIFSFNNVGNTKTYKLTFDVSKYKELAPVTSKQRIGY